MLRDASHGVGELLRPDVVFTAVRVREAGVRFEDEGQVGIVGHPLDDRLEVLRTEGAVDTECADAEAGERERGRFGGDAREGAPRGLEGHGDEDRLSGRVFPGGQHRRLGLVEVRHGLDDDDIGLICRVHLLREEVIGVFEGEGAGRFEELADGADIEGDEDLGALGRGLRVLERRFDDGVGRVAAAFEFIGVGAEGIGVDEVGACVDVGSVEGRDEVRMRHVERLRVMVIGDTALLDKRAGGTVEEQEFPFVQERFKIHSGHLVVCNCSCPAGCRRRSPVCVSGAPSPRGP